MSSASTLESPETHPHTAADDHGHGHHPFLAHHFEDMEQQFQAGKLGIWLFLAQEVLFFSGLFAAYTVYRYNHPEVFVNAHKHLNTTLGAVNTVVLLASSLAIAWGVRAVMRNDRQTVLYTHVFTLACAALFMGIKTVEYTHKWDEGIAWAGAYTYAEGAHDAAAGHSGGWHNIIPGLAIGSLIVGAALTGLGAAQVYSEKVVRGWIVASLGVSVASLGLGIVVANYIMQLTGPGHAVAADHAAHDSHTSHDAPAPAEAAAPVAADATAAAPAAGPVAPNPRFNAANFFSIYFAMTGVHALHIIAGMIAITWIIARTAAGHFSAEYYGPVEYVGLYWHIVDLVWIYLFPLLYLIH
ncbi:MAG: cytochrome c oxidase subunit 3 [Lacipirellulaceae bacterium]